MCAPSSFFTSLVRSLSNIFFKSARTRGIATPSTKFSSSSSRSVSSAVSSPSPRPHNPSRRVTVFSIFFTMIAFAYYHQALDPTSAANVQRAPAPALGEHPDHYNRPYDAPPYPPYGAPPYGAPPYGAPPAQPQYAPPPGPPPSDMGYGVGMGIGVGGEPHKERDLKDDAASETTKFDDPFADFDAAPSKSADAGARAHSPTH